MTIWIDAQLSPAIAKWITKNFSIQAVALRDLRLRDATDRQIFAAAQQAGAVVITKDSDFVELVNRYGAPPQIIWLTCGNTSNAPHTNFNNGVATGDCSTERRRVIDRNQRDLITRAKRFTAQFSRYSR